VTKSLITVLLQIFQKMCQNRTSESRTDPTSLVIRVGSTRLNAQLFRIWSGL